MSGWDIPILWTNLVWRKFSSPTASPRMESTPSAGLFEAPQSETNMILDSILGADNNSDSTPVESHGSCASLDPEVLKAELNFILGFVLGLLQS